MCDNFVDIPSLLSEFETSKYKYLKNLFENNYDEKSSISVKKVKSLFENLKNLDENENKLEYHNQGMKILDDDILLSLINKENLNDFRNAKNLSFEMSDDLKDEKKKIYEHNEQKIIDQKYIKDSDKALKEYNNKIELLQKKRQEEILNIPLKVNDKLNDFIQKKKNKFNSKKNKNLKKIIDKVIKVYNIDKKDKEQELNDYILNDRFRDFIRDRIEYYPLDNKTISINTLYDKYRIWHRDCHPKEIPKKRKELIIYLDKFYEKVKGDYYKGLKIKTMNNNYLYDSDVLDDLDL